MPQEASLEQCLDDLESRIDESIEQRLLDEWKQFCDKRHTGKLFTPSRPEAKASQVALPAVTINQAMDDFDKMALREFASCQSTLNVRGGSLLMVRSNYGTPIMPVLFGCKLFIMADELNTLPGCHAVAGGADAMKAMLDRGVPSLDHPHIRKVFEMGRRYVAIARKYPKIGRWVYVYHPDLQGPLDVLEMVWGSDIFLNFYDHPDVIHGMLRLICDTYISFMREWEKVVPTPVPGYGPHWGILHKGRIMLRDDSAMNLSPGMFNEFMRPYDERLLRELGGGAMHSCGRVEHFVPFLADMPGLHAFNLSQPHLNDMETVFKNTIDRGLTIVGLSRAAGDAAVAAGRDLHGLVNCWA